MARTPDLRLLRRLAPRPMLTQKWVALARPVVRRTYSTESPAPPPPPQKPNGHEKEKSKHALFYSQLLPTWLPIIVIGSAVFLSLQMLRSHLAQSRFTTEITQELSSLQAEYDMLHSQRQRAQEAEMRGREGGSELHVLAATLPTLVNPTGPEGMTRAPGEGDAVHRETAAGTSPAPGPGSARAQNENKSPGSPAGKSWWSTLVGR
ncbi:hypothetical protein CALCODRAFT_490200 [Calocera cornea HHB12733]|uniref:Uncharacterized protein n=1 Tax=Calocera cornea HHB12733 TaxID=1353952 RepID=A0A165JWY1_9BASI|nr:hypothetical protein CALCODRAFT_490200 [Calocera cornea HHB12733]